MSKETKLKPCPFCDGEAEITDHGDGMGGWMISCKKNCGVLMAARPKRSYPKDVDIHKMGKEMTISAWNKRYFPKATGE